MLIKYFRDNFPESKFGMNEAYDILQECYKAMDESQLLHEKFDPFNDANYVDTARKYTSALFIESANQMEDAILEDLDNTEAALNGYLINYVHLIKKYKARIKDNKDKFDARHYQAYEYPKYSTFPKPIKKVIDIKSVASDFVSDYVDTDSYQKIRKGADGVIADFTKTYLGDSVKSTELYKIPDMVREIILGDEKDLEVTPNSLMLYIENFQKVSSFKETVKDAKNEVSSFFKLLRDAYSESLNKMHVAKGIQVNQSVYDNIATMEDPKRTIILARQNTVMATMDLEYNRIFTTIAAVYEAVMRTKLSITRNRIEQNIITIKDILADLNLFAGLPDPKNAKSKNVFIKR